MQGRNAIELCTAACTLGGASKSPKAAGWLADRQGKARQAKASTPAVATLQPHLQCVSASSTNHLWRKVCLHRAGLGR